MYEDLKHLSVFTCPRSKINLPDILQKKYIKCVKCTQKTKQIRKPIGLKSLGLLKMVSSRGQVHSESCFSKDFNQRNTFFSAEDPSNRVAEWRRDSDVHRVMQLFC